MSTIRAAGKGAAARSSILDAAERLFAESGYDGVPVREIAKAAGLGLSLVTYHFPSKDELFEQVLARRTEPLNALRRGALEAFEADGATDLRRLVDAYTRPFLILMADGDDGWRAYGELIAQTAQTRKLSPLVTRHYDDVARMFARSLQRLYPAAAFDDVVRAVAYSVPVMLSVFSAIRRVDSISQGSVSSADPHAAYPSMIDFIAGGIETALTASGDRGGH